MGEKWLIPVPAQRLLILAYIPRKAGIANGRWNDHAPTCACSVEKRRVKTHYLPAVGAGSFGKKQDRNTMLQSIFHCRNGFPCAQTALAIDKDCSSQPPENSEERPGSNLALGNKRAGYNRGKNCNIQIAEMVGSDQDRSIGQGGTGRKFDAHADAERAGQPSATAAHPLRPRTVSHRVACAAS